MEQKARRLAAACLLVVTGLAGSRSGQVTWGNVLEQPGAFYASAEARRLADHVLLYQRVSGGWPKDLDMTRPPAAPPPARPDATIDNGATTTQIRLLARVAAARVTAGEPPAPAGAPLSPDPPARKYRDAVRRGVEYLLAAQYANGGWPQFFPLRTDYSRYITYNDNAMVNVLTLLEEVASGQAPFDFLSAELRRAAASSVQRGIAVTLKTQIRAAGSLTVWCAQYDEVTLEPRAARTFEPAALSGSESVGIVRFLMRQPPTPDIVRAVDAAVAWFERSRLPDGRWARFYEPTSNRPIFAGRDGIIRYSVDEIEAERREGYAWFGTWPQRLVEREYSEWKKKHHQPRASSADASERNLHERTVKENAKGILRVTPWRVRFAEGRAPPFAFSAFKSWRLPQAGWSPRLQRDNPAASFISTAPRSARSRSHARSSAPRP